MTEPSHHGHPVFELLDVRPVDPPDGFAFEYPGVVRRREFVADSPVDTKGLWLTSVLVPPVDEEYFEWIDVLESVVAADERFCMLELGAGYGRWLVRSAVALRLLKPAVKPYLIGVEAEPTHFRWMQMHFEDNGINRKDHLLVEAAVDSSDGDVYFAVGQPDEWYGQAIVAPGTPGYELARVPAIGLSGLLADVDTVDLIDLDVQGAELRVLRSAIDDLDRKVKRVHIGTHSDEIEVGLRELFARHGWVNRCDFRCAHSERTPFGEVFFSDGVQTWLNPFFGDAERLP